MTIGTASSGTTKPSGPPELRGFTLAGTDGKFYPAKARIDGDSVVLYAEEVIAPIAARYAFTKFLCETNLFNTKDCPVPASAPTIGLRRQPADDNGKLPIGRNAGYLFLRGLRLD